MRPDSRRPSVPRSRILPIAWGLASALFLFTAENIWIDPWLRSKSERIPSLVPQALSGVWFLEFAVCGIALVLLVLCQILLMRDGAVRMGSKFGTGIAMLLVMLLSVQWVRVTSGYDDAILLRQARSNLHSVTLTWKASTSQVAGYNVYRSMKSGSDYAQINSSLVDGLTYTDTTVVSGETYYYVARAVDTQSHESINSNETSAHVP